MIENQKGSPHFLKKIPEQAEEIDKRLEILSGLLLSFFQKPGDFTLIHGQITDGEMDAPTAEVVFKKKSDPNGPRLYFRERNGQTQRIYVAVLRPKQLNPFGDEIAVPEISIWPSGFGVKSNLFLLIEGEKFCFNDRRVDMMGDDKIQLLGRFVETYAKKFLS